MISRFTNIKGIGRFLDCRQISGREFSKNTIIFGQNTGGKSTLTDILWSFKTGDNAIIEGRKTFGFKDGQQVEFIDENNKSYKFPSADWNQGFENIEIFDTQFINENIFEGNGISYGQQKNLQSVIIGTKGKKLASEINILQDELQELTNKKTAKTSEFNKRFKKEISIETFSKLMKVENVDDEIKELELTIETANNQIKIKSTFEAIENLFKIILNQTIKDVLSNSIEAKAELVAEHVLKTWKNPSHSKDFLQTGLKLTKDEKTDCVFCGQELNINAKNLLSSYTQLFSQEYIKLQSEISLAIINFEKWNPITFLESIVDKLASIKINFVLNLVSNEELKQLKDIVNAEFSEKLKDISYTVDFDMYYSLIEIFEKIKMEIDELKQKNVFTSVVNIDKLNKRIKELEFSKIRHTQEWYDFFTDYESLEKIWKIKQKKREELREELNKYSKQIFLNHFNSINKTLHELNADFSIFDFKPIEKIVGKEERIFTLRFFNNHGVSINENSTNKPNFKNTLSDSDKRVLAFAFFFSLMINDDKLHEKIIVFDDPFSSFDSDRRSRTIGLLANPHLTTPDGKKVEKKLNQLIILTHESEFFKWLYRRLDNPKPLKIIPDGDSNGVKKSKIEDCNVEKEFIEDENLKDLKEIEDTFSSNKPIQNYDGLCKKCRVILEGIFKRKYLFDLEEEINKDKSVRTFVDSLKKLKINEFENVPKYKDFFFLCDNLNIELHDNTFKNDGGNAQSVLGDFLRLIKQI